MGRIVIKKPNGKYAIWTTICDDFLFDDITKEQYLAFRRDEEIKRIEKDLEEIFTAIDGNKPEEVYNQFAMTYEEALERKK